MANAGSDVILSEGSLQEDHTLPGVRSLGVSRSLRLVYDSTSADVRPIIPLDTTLSLRTAVPLTFSAALQVGGVTQGAEVFYDATSLPESADSTSRLAVQFDGSSLPTGRYPFTAGVFSHYAQSAVGAFVESEAIVVNQRQSPIGAGWGIAGLQRLHLQPDGVVLLTDGDGSALAFRPATLGRFAATISMTTRHNRFPAMVLLADGRVLVTGGFNAAGITAAAEIFDPATGTWTATGSMREARQLHTATLLRDGRVLIAGGADQSDGPKSSAELYDPATGQFTYTTGGMNRIRAAHTATLLGDGTVLIAAGASNLGAGISSGEIFNPVTGTFQFTANNMQVDISYHTATLLADGRVLITGGQGRCGFGANRITHIYDPLTRTFARSGNLTIDRSGHRADLLSDGRVLIAGGAQLNACGHEGLTDTIEIFDPVAGASQALPDRLCATKAFPTLAPLGDGRLLIAGGMNVERTGFMTACADIFDPETGILSRTTDMTTPRGRHAATALADGRVLVVGTAFGTDPVDWADLFDVVTAESGAFLSPAGDFTTLTRNPDGTFVRAFKDGTHVRFDVSGLQTSVVDRNGNTTAYSYDPAGRLLTMTDPAGLIWTLAYGAGGLIESITDPAARTTTFEHDAQGNLTKITKPDGTCVHYAYDSQHRLVQKTNERGFPTTYAYDFSGRFASATHPGGEVRRAVGAQTRGVVDPSGGAGTSLNPAPIVRIEDVTATFTDGKDHATTYVLDGLGVATGQTDALGRTTGTVRDANGLPRQITRPNGSVVTMTYEGRGNLLTVTEENDPNGPATTAYTYEPAFNQVTSIRDPKGNTTMIAHDARGNPTTITDALGKSTILTYDSRGLLTSSRDPLGNTATFGYDAQGNVETVTDPRMKTTMLGRDVAGNVTSSRDPLLRVTQTQYDAVNRVTQVTYPLNGITRYGYDEAGNLASLTDAKNQTTTFAYEGRSLLSETTNPLGQTKHYFYDLAEHTLDAKGQRIEFGYDASDQLIAKVLKDASGATTDTVTYGYDLLGNLAAASDSDSGLAFTFDPLGRLAEARTLAGAAQPATTISYAYDKNGNRVRMTDPHGNLTTYGYDPLNRLTTLTSPDGVFTFGYDDAGRRTSLTFPNGARAAYSYDAASQLTSLHYLDAAMALLSKFDYTYDDKGNRESRTTLDGVTTYTYDDLDRLTGAVGPDPANPLQTATESYAYDSVGNRTSSHLATGQVHDVANRLLEDSKFIYTYDANGNLISKLDRATNELTTYEWDVLDQLIAANSPAPLVTFQYDPLGRRMSKVSSTMMRFVYDREDVVEERDGTSALSLRYLHGPGIDEPLGRFDAITNTVSYYAADGLGSITETTNSSGQVSPAYRFDSYGTPVDGHETGGFAFTGREWDPESGLYYYRSRYLDPVMGRFLSEDPAGATAGLNLFAYVGNSPTEWIDPFGLRRRAEYLAAGSPYDLLYHSAIRIYDDERRDVPDLVYSAGGLTSGTYTYQRYRDLRGSEPTDRFPLVLSEDQIRSLQMILEAKFPNGGFYAYDTLTNNCAQVAASSIYEAVGRSGPGILGNLYIGDFGIILTTHQAILHLAIDGLLEDQVR
jgi:RHS repeat-associated protein